MKNLVTAPFRLVDEIMSKILIFRKSTQKKIMLICFGISVVLTLTYLIVYALLGSLKYSILLSLATMCLFYIILYKIIDNQLELDTEEEINLSDDENNLSEDEEVTVPDTDEILEDAIKEIKQEDEQSKVKTHSDYTQEELNEMTDEEKLLETMKLASSSEATSEQMLNSIQMVELEDLMNTLNEGNYIDDEEDEDSDVDFFMNN